MEITSGTGGGGGGGAVTVADGADVALGAKADAAATTDTGTFSLIALFKRLLATGLQVLPYSRPWATWPTGLRTPVPRSKSGARPTVPSRRP
jgi:hypothetical protein